MLILAIKLETQPHNLSFLPTFLLRAITAILDKRCSHHEKFAHGPHVQVALPSGAFLATSSVYLLPVAEAIFIRVAYIHSKLQASRSDQLLEISDVDLLT